jgi:hypothetical protein
MPANSYHLVSHWRVDGTAHEVSDILEDASVLSSWWGSVYSDVSILEEGAEDGTGKVFSLLGKGWLPYTLHLTFREIDRRYPNGFTVAVSGDLNGVGVWTFAQDGPSVDISFDWTVAADKAILRWFSPALKLVFVSNHRWTMRRGEESLRLELLRRRAQTDEQRSQVPPPPAPFRLGAGWLIVAAASGLAMVASVFRLVRRRRKT